MGNPHTLTVFDGNEELIASTMIYANGKQFARVGRLHQRLEDPWCLETMQLPRTPQIFNHTLLLMTGLARVRKIKLGETRTYELGGVTVGQTDGNPFAITADRFSVGPAKAAIQMVMQGEH